MITAPNFQTTRNIPGSSIQSPVLTAYVAIILLAIPVAADGQWRTVDADNFSQIQLIADRRLTEEEIARTSGCLGYALVETLCGEQLSDPVVSFDESIGGTVLTFDYDSTKSRRSDPNHACAFQKASYYITYGTPIRVTDRAGEGSKGTSLVNGLGQDVEFAFLVR